MWMVLCELSEEKTCVCVRGGGGGIAQWLVHLTSD